MSKDNRIHIINLKPVDFSRVKGPSGKFSDTTIKWSSTAVKFSKKV
jgi:hypothetical protein